MCINGGTHTKDMPWDWGVVPSIKLIGIRA